MHDYPAWLLALVVAVCTMLVIELGFRLGDRARERNKDVDAAFGIVQNSVLGLMAFLLGFAFSYATGRYDTRQNLEQAEANAIGTAWMRTELLDSPARESLRALFPRYVTARLEFYRAGLVDRTAMAEKHAVSDEVQEGMWKIVTVAFKEQTNPRISLVAQALNDMFDNGGNVEENRSRRTPPILFLLLFFSIILGGSFIGYGFGRAGARSIPAWLLFVMVTALVIYVVGDLLRPERGLIRADHEPLVGLSQSFKPPGSDASPVPGTR